jgi:hypothetical protein
VRHLPPRHPQWQSNLPCPQEKAGPAPAFLRAVGAANYCFDSTAVALRPCHEPRGAPRQLDGLNRFGRPQPLLDGFGRNAHVLCVNQPEPDRRDQIKPAGLVEQAGRDVDRLAGMGRHGEPAALVRHAPDQRRGLQLHVHALRPVLEEPLPFVVVLVVAVDEVDQLVVSQHRALGLQEWPLRLGAVVAHVPVAARVEAEPVVAVRHVGPLGERLFDDVVHLFILPLVAQWGRQPKRRHAAAARCRRAPASPAHAPAAAPAGSRRGRRAPAATA